MAEDDSVVASWRGPLRKFNPGTLQSDAEIIEQFAVRSAELTIVLDVLRGNLDSPSCQHALIVAPHGCGKTMLLARCAAELRTNTEFAEFLVPVRFMEESHEISDISDFWLETLFHFAREVAPAHPGLASELRATHASLCDRWRERGLGDLARAAVLNAADRMRCRLVLMVENLQTLTANTDADFGWQLRSALQSEPSIMLLASATSRFDGLDDAREPFFELFRIVNLRPLGTDQCRCLWEAAGGDPRGGRDIRPLEILTGGNPRLLVIVAGFARHRSLRQLMEELVALVDEHTEYFRGHLEVLPKVERRVFVAVIDLWRPSTAAEIAARARMDVRTVSTMLGRLTDRGAVAWHVEAHSPKRLYIAAEPLYSIYYKLRRERDEAAVVESLIMFMTAFYEPSALFEDLDNLRTEAIQSAPPRSVIEQSVDRRSKDPRVTPRMAWDELGRVSLTISNKHHLDAAVRLQDETDAAFGEGNWAGVIELVDRYVEEGWSRSPAADSDFETAYLGRLRAQAHFGLGEHARVVEIGQDLFRRFHTSQRAFLKHQTGIALMWKADAHTKLGDFRGAAESARALVSWFGERTDTLSGPLVANALLRHAAAEIDLGNVDLADTLLEEVVARFGNRDVSEFHPPVVRALVERAKLVGRLGVDERKAVALYDAAISRGCAADLQSVGEPLAEAFLKRAIVLGRLGDFDGEVASYGEFVDVFGDRDGFEEFATLALAVASLRQAEIGKVEEALSGCAEAESRLTGVTNGYASWIKGIAVGARATALAVRGETDAAMQMFRDALGEFPAAHELSMRAMTRLSLNLIAIGAPEREVASVLASDKANAASMAPVLVALRERAGKSVRVPEAVRSVAQDVRGYIEKRTDQRRLVSF